MATDDEIRHRHTFHPLPDDGGRRARLHELTRDATGDLAVRLNYLLPESREKSLALTAVQEAMLWANAALALHGTPSDQE